MLRNDNGTMIDWLGQANGGFVDNSANFAANIPASWHVEDPLVHPFG